jgi:hypothetical protein
MKGRAEPATAEQCYAAVVAELTRLPGVTAPSGPDRPGNRFGSNALKTRKKIFAMFVRGSLVVKLPQGRIDELIAAGAGTRFDAGRGRPMREWFVAGEASRGTWIELARAALRFVTDSGPGR